MTMFIACLLIYHYDMAWWWYGVAAAIWVLHPVVLAEIQKL